MWVASSIVVIGLILAILAMEWGARPPRDQGISILTLYETNKAGQLPPNVPPPPPGFVVIGEQLRHGFFVRREWGPGALLWGLFFPLCLAVAAGFIALGGKKTRP